MARLSGSIYRVKDECEVLRPTISLNGNSLSSTFSTTPPTGTTYQWLFNGFPIPAATANSYQITTSGTYSLQVNGTNSCLVESDTLFAVFTGIYEEATTNEVKIYPNPFNEITAITFTQSGNYTINLYNIDGKLVDTKNLKKAKHVKMKKNDLAAGTYLLSITGDVKFQSLLIIQ